MKKMIRSRKGFTLVEMLIVIAIIVILAGAAAFGIKEKIDRANQNADAVKLHAAGGKFWKIENGKVVEIGPDEYDPSNPNHRSGGAMDMSFDEVKYIQGTLPPSGGGGGYTPGGGGSVNPGGGSGGDNPGGNPGDNPGGGGDTPELWNGHTEDWWNKNDADWEKKIQDLKNQGIPPENIHVTRDERGHITGVTWNNPNSGNGNSGAGSNTGGQTGGNTGGNTGNDNPGNQSGTQTGTTVNSVNLPNGVQTDDHKAGAYEVKDLGGGKTQVGLQTNAWYRQTVTIEKQGNNYVLHVSGNNRYVLQGANHEYQNIWPNLDKDNQTYTLNKDQIECLKSFGINLI